METKGGWSSLPETSNGPHHLTGSILDRERLQRNGIRAQVEDRLMFPQQRTELPCSHPCLFQGEIVPDPLISIDG